MKQNPFAVCMWDSRNYVLQYIMNNIYTPAHTNHKQPYKAIHKYQL